MDERMEYSKSILGKDITITDFAKDGSIIDVAAITKGKGFQGAIKRWGFKLLSHKNSKHRRMVGTLAPKSPGYVRPTVPQAGQMGYHQRTEINKRVLKIGTNGEEITPKGGFLHYGTGRQPLRSDTRLSARPDQETGPPAGPSKEELDRAQGSARTWYTYLLRPSRGPRSMVAKKKSESKINVYSLSGDVIQERRPADRVPRGLPPRRDPQGGRGRRGQQEAAIRSIAEGGHEARCLHLGKGTRCRARPEANCRERRAPSRPTTSAVAGRSPRRRTRTGPRRSTARSGSWRKIVRPGRPVRPGHGQGERSPVQRRRHPARWSSRTTSRSWTPPPMSLPALQSIGLEADVVRAKDGKKVRPGKGKMSGRRYKSARSILIVVSRPGSARCSWAPRTWPAWRSWRRSN